MSVDDPKTNPHNLISVDKDTSEHIIITLLKADKKHGAARATIFMKFPNSNVLISIITLSHRIAEEVRKQNIVE